ncbi:hypothetical protein AMAG_19738 [Allomyces macrogynus ATCC 38327]|uniref:Uncharacterized protein n=1 Tax=Allomyces macrogynus (strain ATCC 38327) TaxID=578462 RepID=A0A0L0T1A4_ALLM3|nr:hypothetical protein AMAG_19738 [Allomyces macrogynus ATCC 38327]|eukprot:KNE68521.1 hypothetical protein AMAG_19738 [Allomyces macrogynus ATCC 38327]
MNPTRSGDADPFLCTPPPLSGTVDAFAAALGTTSDHGTADIFKDYTFVAWDEPKSTTAATTRSDGSAAPTVAASAGFDAATLSSAFRTVDLGMPAANTHVTKGISPATPDTYNPLSVADEDAPVLESGDGLAHAAATGATTIHGIDAAAAIKSFGAIVPFLAHPMIGRARQHVGSPFETPPDAILGFPAPVVETVEPAEVESVATAAVAAEDELATPSPAARKTRATTRRTTATTKPTTRRSR